MDQQAYLATYPEYCRTCNGTGIRKTYPYHRAVIRECSSCLAKGFCPRCKRNLPDHSYTCTACQWSPSNPHGGLPAQ